MSNIVDWGKERNIAVANMALHDGFIKESAFDILCQKSIRTYAAYILTNILDYLIGERYNGRQI